MTRTKKLTQCSFKTSFCKHFIGNKFILSVIMDIMTVTQFLHHLMFVTLIFCNTLILRFFLKLQNLSVKKISCNKILVIQREMMS